MRVSKLVRNFFDRLSIGDVKINRDFLIFLIFLVISSAFWLLNALRDQYVTEFSYPVRFVNIPANQSIVKASGTEISLRVRANGYTILRHKLSGLLSSISLDFSKAHRENRFMNNIAYILPRHHYNVISDKLIGIEILDIYPDTFFLSIDSIARRLVSIKHKGIITFNQPYNLAGEVMFEPGQVEIAGPHNIVDTIVQVYTKPFVAENLSDTLTRTVDLDPFKGVSFSSNRVKVIIPVEPFSEKEVLVPVEVASLPDTLRLKTFPSEVTVIFRVGLSRFDKVNESSFRAVVDAREVLGHDRPNRLRVRLEQVPDGIVSLDFNPLFVDYLVERPR